MRISKGSVGVEEREGVPKPMKGGKVGGEELGKYNSDIYLKEGGGGVRGEQVLSFETLGKSGEEK